MDLLLTEGPLANVDMEGRSVPPKAISTSLGGCLKLKIEKYGKSSWSGAILAQQRARSVSEKCCAGKSFSRSPHLISENLDVEPRPRCHLAGCVVKYPPGVKVSAPCASASQTRIQDMLQWMGAPGSRRQTHGLLNAEVFLFLIIIF